MMGWRKRPPGDYSTGGGGWWLGALIPDPAGCLSWIVGAAVIAGLAAWVLT